MAVSCEHGNELWEGGGINSQVNNLSKRTPLHGPHGISWLASRFFNSFFIKRTKKKRRKETKAYFVGCKTQKRMFKFYCWLHMNTWVPVNFATAKFTRPLYISLMNFEGQTEVRECLLPLGAEPFVFQFAIQKFKDRYNLARCFAWM